MSDPDPKIGNKSSTHVVSRKPATDVLSKPQKIEENILSISSGKTDQFDQVQNSKAQQPYKKITNDLNKLQEELNNIKNNQGWIGRLFDFMKNTFGCSTKDKSWFNPTKWISFVLDSDNGSASIQKSIKELKEKVAELEKLGVESSRVEQIINDSKISEKIKAYEESQNTGVDVISDLLSGIASFTSYTIAAAAFAALTVTGGSTLLITVGALSFAALTGSLSKLCIKSFDSSTGRKKYNSFGYDLATGAFSGILAPLTSATGSLVSGNIAKFLGLKVVSHAVGKSITTDIAIQGGRTITRFGLYGTRMAVEGASAGSVDNTFRHIVKTGSLDGATDAFTSGFTGGLILSPVIGGSIHGVGKAAKVLKSVENGLRDGRAIRAKAQTKTSILSGPQILNTFIGVIMDPVGTFERLRANTRFETNFGKFLTKGAAKLQLVVENPKYIFADESTRLQMILEAAGISPGKVCQMLASEEAVPSSVRTVFEKMKSGGTPTRTLPQAQELVDSIYGTGKYKVERNLGVGTVGEGYMGKNHQGRSVVVKLIKEGVSPEILETEKAVILEAIRETVIDLNQRTFLMQTIENLFSGWTEELNLLLEAQKAVDLSKNAKRYKVALPLEVGFDKANPKRAISLVYEVAQGIQLDKLIEILKLYKENPERYFCEFDTLMKEHPWLVNPKQWLHQLPDMYLKAQNEQLLFLRRGQLRATHGDPHTGNIFVNYEDRRLVPTYIDTGLTVTRNPKEVINHLGFLINLIFGNSKGIAKRIVENAQGLPKNCSREELIKRLAEKIEGNLFKSDINLTDLQSTFGKLKSITMELGIVDSASDSLISKAQVQSIMNYWEISALADQPNNRVISNSIGDIIRGIFKLTFLSPSSLIKTLYDPIRHFFRDPYNTTKTASQFI